MPWFLCFHANPSRTDTGPDPFLCLFQKYLVLSRDALQLCWERCLLWERHSNQLPPAGLLLDHRTMPAQVKPGGEWRSLCFITMLRSPCREGFALCLAQLVLRAKELGRLHVPGLPLEIPTPLLEPCWPVCLLILKVPLLPSPGEKLLLVLKHLFSILWPLTFHSMAWCKSI